jgi:DNA-binding response OmpR family regulator
MRPLKILHVEDKTEDALLFGRACEAAGLQADCYTVHDGSEAVAYLEGRGKFTDRHAFPLPDLIVMDLELPVMDGFDFLKWLRQQANFLLLPVLVFTRSTSEEDKVRALNQGATGYFTKPKDFKSLVRLAESWRQRAGNGKDKNEQTA